MTPSPVTEPGIDEPEQLEFEFMPQDEVIEVGDTKVVFREPTEEELPSREVSRADGGIIKSDFFTGDKEWAATVVGKSPAGASLQITKRREGTGYVLSYRDGGNVPNHLSGWFTTFDKAESAGRAYLAGLWDQARKAG